MSFMTISSFDLAVLFQECVSNLEDFCHEKTSAFVELIFQYFDSLTTSEAPRAEAPERARFGERAPIAKRDFHQISDNTADSNWHSERRFRPHDKYVECSHSLLS
jgi:hypothetical protein